MVTATAAPAVRATGTLGWIRLWLVIFVVGLVVSGVTAFPLPPEVAFATTFVRDGPLGALLPGLLSWLERVDGGLQVVARHYPFILYGTDWLAFAHLVIAVAFVGPLRDPVRNVWVIEWGMIACAGVIPLALIAGAVRGIPFGWQCIDMSFGVVGIVPLLIVLRLLRRLPDVPVAR